ncbi:MAG: phosphoenolpyruvate synthase [Paenibacillaceae bacterium]|jgi:pyruvate,water dikinase|nr:phosphoenolpyruvate synthase [Paenibacillaceae bacterium]
MSGLVVHFGSMTSEQQKQAGGKGAMLSRMFQAGYPVPEGWVVLPSAFSPQSNEEQPHEMRISDPAWRQLRDGLARLRAKDKDTRFAVRSSALSEDSAHASFAGEFETVLNAATDDEIYDAIDAVARSAHSGRVQAYSSAQGIDEAHRMAVVVQRMVPSDISGVLFTADPLTGSHSRMVGNFVHGLGEKLVSGESDAAAFTIARPQGAYEGPADLAPHAKQLHRYAVRLEEQFGRPQDIEWAIADGKLYLLQARPITTLTVGDPDSYEWNDTLDGDELWVNTNIGEAICDVMTPLTWSTLRHLDNMTSTVPGYYLVSGNICGRAYTNISRRLSILAAFGVDMNRGARMMNDVLGQFPPGEKIPVTPFSRKTVAKEVIPRMAGIVRKLLSAYAGLARFLRETPDWCERMRKRIIQTETVQQLASLGRDELIPYNVKALFSLLAGAGKSVLVTKVKKELVELVGLEDANALLSNLRGGAELASLGPVTGIAKVRHGTMSREEYLRHYGHRGPHEFELSIPHPAEDEGWLDAQLADIGHAQTDVEALLSKQQAKFDEAWAKFRERYPHKARRMAKRIARVGEAARLRETARSEWIRVLRLNRTFALRVGELTGIGEDVFFLYQDELPKLLAGDRTALKHIPARKQTYKRYQAFPPFPSAIRGRFDPAQWAQDPNRRLDYYDAGSTVAEESEQSPDDQTITLRGFAGAAGRVEGSVRVLASPEEGSQLQVGEILVASTTNVGWTPLFPKAAAIVTDIGAPLSHAAIVARELGIPAVVGCGNATRRLATGDRVLVDGGQGVVRMVKPRT